MQYARVEGGIVVELWTAPHGQTPESCFHSDVAKAFVPVPAGVSPQQGWRYVDGIFEPPA